MLRFELKYILRGLKNYVHSKSVFSLGIVSLGIDVCTMSYKSLKISGSNKTCIQMVSFIRKLSWFQMFFITG